MKVLWLVLFIASCVNSGFGGSNKGKQQGAAEQSPLPSAPLVSTPPLACVGSGLSFHFTFVIDATGSMKSVLDLVKSNIVAFVNAIRAALGASLDANSKIFFSAVTYVDGPEPDGDAIVMPTDNPDTFATQLQKLSVPRGGINDQCEGGLYAVAKAATIQANYNPGVQNLVPAIVVVSDNWSHAGTGSSSSRDFNPQSTLTALNAPIYAKNLVLIDSVPKDVASVPSLGGGCSNHPQTPPSQQWDAIRTSWVAAHPGLNSPGSSVGFPLNSNILLQTIPGLVAKAVKCP